MSSPTPDVHWERTDGRPLPDRAKIQSFGQELLIENLQFEDAGTYECWATNAITGPRVSRTIHIRVDCKITIVMMTIMVVVVMVVVVVIIVIMMVVVIMVVVVVVVK